MYTYFVFVFSSHFFHRQASTVLLSLYNFKHSEFKRFVTKRQLRNAFTHFRLRLVDWLASINASSVALWLNFFWFLMLAGPDHHARQWRLWVRDSGRTGLVEPVQSKHTQGRPSDHCLCECYEEWDLQFDIHGSANVAVVSLGSYWFKRWWTSGTVGQPKACPKKNRMVYVVVWTQHSISQCFCVWVINNFTMM